MTHPELIDRLANAIIQTAKDAAVEAWPLTLDPNAIEPPDPPDVYAEANWPAYLSIHGFEALAAAGRLPEPETLIK